MWLSSQLRAIFSPSKSLEHRRSATVSGEEGENVPTDPASAPTATARVRRFRSIEASSQGATKPSVVASPACEEWMLDLERREFCDSLSPQFEGSVDLDRSFVIAERTEADAVSTGEDKQISMSSLQRSDCGHRPNADCLKPSPARDCLSMPSFQPVFELVQDPPISQKVKLRRGVVGLKNPRLLCYLNASIQCLFSAKAFREYLIALVVARPELDKTCELTYLLGLLAKRMFSLKQGRVHSSRLWQFMHKAFREDAMHDAPEAICYLLNTIDNELRASNIDVGLLPASSQALAWFEGSVFSHTQCSNCRHLHTTLQTFVELSVSVTPTLAKSLKRMGKEEPLDSYRCRACGGCVQAHKTLQLERLPYNLLITVLRFKRDVDCDKVSSYMKFPKVLKLSTYTLHRKAESFHYSLLSVVVHSGSLSAGHYVAYCKRGHKWYLFDDEKYRKVKLKEVMKQEAYILLYEQLHA